MDALARPTPTLDPAFVLRMDRAGPRYTSYPTADRFDTTFGEADYLGAIGRMRGGGNRPLSVYVHLPHCQRICGYCACNVIGTKSPAKRAAYVDLVLRELAQVAGLEALAEHRTLGQFHFGGGTPNSYSTADLTRLIDAVTRRFVPTADAELAIEIDPRLADMTQLVALHTLGMNRVSFGVQDNDARVQEAIGRHQSERETRTAIDLARRAGFGSINIDLVYGLPMQTPETFERTLDLVLDAVPDRVALFSFAYLPETKANQRKIDRALLAPPELKVQMLVRARERLGQAGYLAIGMDHFARPGDALGQAALDPERVRLRRNFQGYTVAPAGLGASRLEVLGLGLTAISDLGGAYAQNHKDIERYAKAVEAGRPPVERGVTLTSDDLGRRLLIDSLMTQGRIEVASLPPRLQAICHDVVASRFAPLIAEGLVTAEPARIVLTPIGELFPRLVAMTFDAHLGRPVRASDPSQPARPTQFSRVV
ncbi:MAG: oxygen-independent coproporphyrinogen III oxidase [Deltaproteobacteria bacterium]|nr:oxygen-independent coproporphyrinogen III oxidase [Deltaproteobacteria bacterium]